MTFSITRLLGVLCQPRLVVLTAIVLVAVYYGHFALQGIQIRRRFLHMKAQGLPIPEPYSAIWGHLPLMKILKTGMPSDAHGSYIQTKLAQDWKEYFPGATECPPIVYLDLWPFMTQAYIITISPELSAQATQEVPQPRHSMYLFALWPVTNSLDLFSMELPDHKIWRSKLAPAFSTKNIASHVPDVVDQVTIFTERLKGLVGKNGEWGEMFTLYDMTVSLTFDIISKFALGISLHEQTKGPGPLLKAMKVLIAEVKLRNLRNILIRMTPSWKHANATNAAVVRDLVMPPINNIAQEIAKGWGGRDTLVHTALREFVGEGKLPDESFIEKIVSNIKILLFAGHDTTAQTVCWMLWELQGSPEAAAKLREEHDSILGRNPEQAGEVIRQNPETLHSLRYTTAVIKETLRLHNMGATWRAGSPGLKLVHDGIVYPTEGGMIQTSPSATHLREDLWPEPMKFIPERFLVPEDDPLRPVPNAWRPFELGNTRCIGEELAMNELKVSLALIMRQFDFDVNYERWAELKNLPTLTRLDGSPAYRCGDGVGFITHDFPLRIKTREHEF